MMQPVGDLARSLLARRELSGALAAQASVSRELTTGRVADPAARLGGNLNLLAALEGDLARGAAFGRSLDQVGTIATAMQTTLAAVDDLAQAMTGRLLAPVTDRDGPVTPTVAADARGAFDSAVAALQVRVGGMSIMAGTRSDGPATDSANALLAAAQAAAAGEVTVAGIAQAITDWFDDPAGYGATGYLGGPARPAQPVGDDDSVALAVTAADPALRRTLAALAIAALSVPLSAALPQDTASGLQRRAGDLLANSQDDRTALAAGLGTTEERIARLSERLDATRAEMEIARSTLIGADPTEAATALEARRTQVETMYAVTARLSRLSLADFLR